MLDKLLFWQRTKVRLSSYQFVTNLYRDLELKLPLENLNLQAIIFFLFSKKYHL